MTAAPMPITNSSANDTIPTRYVMSFSTLKANECAMNT
jgi:hypothetical protein